MTEQPEPHQLNILHVRQEVFMGDHAEAVTTAVNVVPGETVEELVERTLRAQDFGYNRIGRDYITIRVAAVREAPRKDAGAKGELL